MIIEKIVEAVLEHFDITREQVDKAKEIVDMVEFKEINGKRIAYVTVGEGLEVKIVQPEKTYSNQGPQKTNKADNLEKILRPR